MTVYYAEKSYNLEPVSELYDFSDAEKFFKKMFIKFGEMPCRGDSLQAEKLHQERMNENTETTFFITGRGFMIDDYEEIILYVVPEIEWMRMQEVKQ